ncbi:MAG: hypothetical protein QM489_03035 [Candidatus Izemoplasma sp.]
MIKTLKIGLVLFGFFILSLSSVTAADDELVVIYFGSDTCLVCAQVKDEGVLTGLIAQGVTVIEIELGDGPENIELLGAYNYTYGHISEPIGPIIFSGDTFYFDYDDIIEGYINGDILENSADPLKYVDVEEYRELSHMSGIRSLLTALAGGFIDGFNPCAVAMLLLFISLLGFTNNKKLLISVSLTYIVALYISYFTLGLLVVNSIKHFSSNVSFLSDMVGMVIIVLGLGLFLFNIYDYFMTKNNKFGKVKNQLPKFIQKFNKSIMKKFTKVMNNTEKNVWGYISLLLITFGLGVIISFTEFLCTGQVYLPVILQLSLQPDFTQADIVGLLALYNFMFVLPLIVISIIAIKTKSILTVSTFIQEKMHIIKLMTALFFLTLALYYIYEIFIR